MKHALSLCLFVGIVLAAQGVSAQQTGTTVQGNQLQSGSGGLQQTPSGLQGSNPQIFNGTSPNVLDQSSQNFLDDLGISNKSKDDPQQTKIVASSSSSSTHDSKTTWAWVCLIAALIGGITWLWLQLRLRR